MAGPQDLPQYIRLLIDEIKSLKDRIEALEEPAAKPQPEVPYAGKTNSLQTSIYEVVEVASINIVDAEFVGRRMQPNYVPNNGITWSIDQELSPITVKVASETTYPRLLSQVAVFFTGVANSLTPIWGYFNQGGISVSKVDCSNPHVVSTSTVQSMVFGDGIRLSTITSGEGVARIEAYVSVSDTGISTIAMPITNMSTHKFEFGDGIRVGVSTITTAGEGSDLCTPVLIHLINQFSSARTLTMVTTVYCEDGVIKGGVQEFVINELGITTYIGTPSYP